MKPVQAVQHTAGNASLMIAIYVSLYFNTAVAGCAAVARAETDVPKPAFFRRRLRVRLYGLSTHRKASRRRHGIPTHVESSTEYTVQRIRMLGGRDRTRAGRVANACRAAARPATLMTM